MATPKLIGVVYIEWNKHEFAYICLIFGHNRLKMHEESSSRRKADENVQEGAVPAYLLDREETTRAKVCLFCFQLKYL